MDHIIAEMITLQELSVNFIEVTGYRRVMNGSRVQVERMWFFSSYFCYNLYNNLI